MCGCEPDAGCGACDEDHAVFELCHCVPRNDQCRGEKEVGTDWDRMGWWSGWVHVITLSSHGCESVVHVVVGMLRI